MSYIKAKEYLKKYNLEDRIMEFDESSATVHEASLRLNCSEGEIAKTLSLIVTAGDTKIDNSKFKKEFHIKAKMIDYDNVEKLIGHSVGGVCPFGINDGVDVYLDTSLKKYDIVYPACGSSNSAVKLSVSELEKISNNIKWICVCKDNG